MYYTPESLKKLYDMLVDMRSTGKTIIDTLCNNYPEVLYGYRFAEFDDITIENTVKIWYVDRYDELRNFSIPYEVWSKGYKDTLNYIVDQWHKTHKILESPTPNDNPKNVFDYIRTLVQYSIPWRRAIDKATEYSNNGLDPNDYIEEIKKYANE